MPYRTHPWDKHGLAITLSELLRRIPDEEFEGVLQAARDLHQRAEFGNPGLGRNAKPDDPYWFEHQLIEESKKYLDEGKPLKAFSHCLIESNHGHSGFTDQSERVYRRPINDTEREVSEAIRGMIIDIASALLKSDAAAKGSGIMSDGEMSIEAISECLELLGADVPQDLIDSFDGELAKFTAAHPKSDGVARIRSAFQRRFR